METSRPSTPALRRMKSATTSLDVPVSSRVRLRICSPNVSAIFFTRSTSTTDARPPSRTTRLLAS